MQSYFKKGNAQVGASKFLISLLCWHPRQHSRQHQFSAPARQFFGSPYMESDLQDNEFDRLVMPIGIYCPDEIHTRSQTL